jgi:hypothetical protein
MRRGWVQMMSSAPPVRAADASSRMNCGTCVDLPQPGGFEELFLWVLGFLGVLGVYRVFSRF